MPVHKFGRMSDAKTKDTGVSLNYINNNYICSNGGTPVSCSINMNGNTLYNVPDPVNPHDVATKEYADNVRGGGWINRKQDGTYAIKKDLDMNGKKLKNIPPPVEDADAVNKIYTDTLSDETKRYVNLVTPFVNQQHQYTATNNINMRDFTLQNVHEPTNAKDVATKEYVDNSGGGAFEARNGGYNAKGPLYIRGYKIGGIKDPKKGGEAANKRYVDNYVEEYVNDYVEKFKDGNGFFDSPWDINMTGKKLSGLSFPSKSDEAAMREYADKVGNDVREYMDGSSELLGEHFKRLQFAFLKDNGKFVAYTPISMASQPLRDVTELKETNDAVTKKYVDDLIADNVGLGNMNGGGSPFFKENGNYQASHAINMAFKNLLNLSTPSEPFEAATKEYVDNYFDETEEKIKNYKKETKKEVKEFVDLISKDIELFKEGTRQQLSINEDIIQTRLLSFKQLITVTAEFRGSMNRNDLFYFYFFTHSENSNESFTMPLNGKLIKIKANVKRSPLSGAFGLSATPIGTDVENEIVRFPLFVNDEERYIIFNPTRTVPTLPNPLVLNPDDRIKIASYSTNALMWWLLLS